MKEIVLENTMTKESNSSALFAKQCIAEALIHLMEEKDYQKISLTEICETAGFSRMAYYRNFKSKDDILITYMKMLADQFRKDVLRKMPHTSSKSYKILEYAFYYFKNYQRFAQCLLDANLASVLQYGLNYYIDTYVAGVNADMKTKYSLYVYSGGIFNVFSVWIANGLKEDPEEMAQILYERLNKL